MKNNLKIYFLGILAFTFALTSCDKNEDAISEIQKSPKTDILTFATQEDFDKTLVKVNSMTKEERLAWEKEQGFKSFGTICDEFYETIKPESFKSVEEIKAFVTKNSDKIEFYTSSDGETYCVTKDFLSPERYLTNENQTCKINNKVIVYSSNEISTNQSLFMQKAASSVVTAADKSDDKVIKGPGIGDDDSYRLHVWLSTELGGNGTKHYSMLSIKNFYRSLGIWFFKPDVFVTYSLSSNITDSYGVTHLFSKPSTYVRITSSNCSPTFYQDYYSTNINLYPISNPYFLSYSVTAENTITDSDGTCHCKVTMSY